MRKVMLFMTVVLVLLGLNTLSVAKAAEQQDIIQLKGATTSGALIVGKTDPENSVSLNGEQLTVSAEGVVVFGFGRDATGTQQLVITQPDGKKLTRTLDLAPREYKIDRVEGVPQRTVTPDPKQVARARKEAAAVWQARQTFSPDMTS